MERSEIIEKLKDILEGTDCAAAVGKGIDEDAKLLTDLGLTSVGMLYTVIAIEETFGIEFDDVGMNDFQTVRDVVDYIVKKQRV